MCDNDILTKWRLRALSSAAQINFDPILVNETAGILKAIFDKQWLANSIETKYPAVPFPFRQHHIGAALHTAGENQIIEMLELAEYIKYAKSSSVFDILVDGIRSKYDSTLLQLAFAYRFSRIHKVDVEFEPRAKNMHVGDIILKTTNSTFMGECYVPKPSTDITGKLEVRWLIKKALEAVQDHSYVVSICVDLISLPNASQRKEIVNIIKKLADEIEKISYTPTAYPPTRFISMEIANISVGRPFSVEAQKDYSCVSSPQFPKKNTPDILLGILSVPENKAFSVVNPSFDGPRSHHIAIWLPPEHSGFPKDLSMTIQELIGKLKKKFPQTKRDDTSGRFLIVEHWLAEHFARVKTEDIEQLRHNFYELHTGVVGVLFVLRKYDQIKKRYDYTINPMLPKNIDAEFKVLLNQLLTQETDICIPHLKAEKEI